MATAKEKYVIDLLAQVKTIGATALDLGASLENQYFDNGWDSGGGDPIVDGDLAGFNDLTALDVASVITMTQQLNNFFANAVVTQADYAATVNGTRYSDFG